MTQRESTTFTATEIIMFTATVIMISFMIVMSFIGCIDRQKEEVVIEPNIIHNDNWWFETFVEPNSENITTYNPVDSLRKQGKTGKGVNIFVHVANADIDSKRINYDQELAFDDVYPNLPFVIDEQRSDVIIDNSGNEVNSYWHDNQVASLIRMVGPDINIIPVRLGGGFGNIPGLYKSLIKMDTIADSLMQQGQSVAFVSARAWFYEDAFIDDWAKNVKYPVYLASPRPGDVAEKTKENTIPEIYRMPTITVVGAVDLNNVLTSINSQVDDMKYWRIYQGIMTYDYEGSDGHNKGDFIPNFEGTSAATPIYAAVQSIK